MKGQKRVFAVLIIVLLQLQLPAQDKGNKSFGLFENEEILNISLHFDIDTYLKEKPEEDRLDARLTIYTGKSDSISREIKVSARGNFRRRNCVFPPVMLYLKNLETGYSDLDDLGKVKLVSHCKDEELYDTYIMREYIIYKLYNLVTDFSFRARLLNINYYDSVSDSLYANKLGFIIEPVNTLEDRFGVDEIEDIEIRPESIEMELLMKLAVFQYMIANSDWFIDTMHNLKIFGDEDKLENLIAVPYDFDYTGWVNTYYAYPREDLGLEDIRDRAFYGPTRTEDEYRAILDYYLELEDKIIDTIKDFQYLKGHERNDLVRYVRSFYRLYRGDELLKICMDPHK